MVPMASNGKTVQASPRRKLISKFTRCINDMQGPISSCNQPLPALISQQLSKIEQTASRWETSLPATGTAKPAVTCDQVRLPCGLASRRWHKTELPARLQIPPGKGGAQPAPIRGSLDQTGHSESKRYITPASVVTNRLPASSSSAPVIARERTPSTPRYPHWRMPLNKTR